MLIITEGKESAMIPWDIICGKSIATIAAKKTTVEARTYV
jgi:hypothetical protein